MPLALIVAGLLLMTTAVKDTYVPATNQIVEDFSGAKGFWQWIIALGFIGAIGYYSPAKTFSNAFMALVIIAMVLSNSRRGDIITQVQQAFTNPVAPPRPKTAAAGKPFTTADAAKGALQGAGPLGQAWQTLDIMSKAMGIDTQSVTPPPAAPSPAESSTGQTPDYTQYLKYIPMLFAL